MASTGLRGATTRLSGWGQYPRVPCKLVRARGIEEVLDLVRSASSLIARGNGRSYGDASLNVANTISMLPNDRLLAFDPGDGLLTCEAGVLLSDVIDVFLPQGWFPPVTPGTKHVTIGGMIASDVHGKNHHVAGSFGRHVESLDLALPNGRVLRCSRAENAELFEGTCGGMGLTGIILRATFRMIPVATAMIRRDAVRARNLGHAMDLFEASNDWTYTVAWIDCLARGDTLGRSILFRGEHAKLDEIPEARRRNPLSVPHKRTRRVPPLVPAGLLNHWSVGAFNEIYYRRASLDTELVEINEFFYPLDGLANWFRLYGPAGFIQYQCVLPKMSGRAGMTALLERISASGLGSFLGVLKLFGAQEGLLSFPMEGYTLALDFPVTSKLHGLTRELDAIVRDHSGRIYLAKDSCSAPNIIAAGYPRLPEFRKLRANVDPEGKFTSVQALRLGL